MVLVGQRVRILAGRPDMSVIAGETGVVIDEFVDGNRMERGLNPEYVVRVLTDMKMEQFVDFTNPLRRLSGLPLMDKVVESSALTRFSDTYGNSCLVQTGWTDREVVVRMDEVRPLMLETKGRR